MQQCRVHYIFQSVVVRTLNVINFHINIMDKNTIFGTCDLYTILFKNFDESNLKL